MFGDSKHTKKNQYLRRKRFTFSSQFPRKRKCQEVALSFFCCFFFSEESELDETHLR